MPENKITWSTDSLKQIGKAIEYIRQDSVQNTENVYSKLIKKLDKVAKNPSMCPPDKFKKDNNGNFRAFVLFRYRVSYRIKIDEIRILRIRHTSMKPRYY